MIRRPFVLCDPEQDYARQMAAFLEADRDFPWKVTVYSKIEEAEMFLRENERGILLLAESLLSGETAWPGGISLIVLNESGMIRFPDIPQIDKYQEAENIRRELLRLLVHLEEGIYPDLKRENPGKVIALYSPVRRCLQTYFGVTYSQLLAREGRVLYMNWGHFSGISELEAAEISLRRDDLVENEGEISCGEGERDLGALLFYLEDANRFSFHMKGIVRKRGNWEYVLSMRNACNLPDIPVRDWLELIRLCREEGNYDYIVLDLSESLQGLGEILRYSEEIYMIVKEDPVSEKKVQKYEYIMEHSGYGDLTAKTRKLCLPLFDKLPGNLEEYTRGELADYVEKWLREER